MYVNKCIKCGKEFETKNPKRVICPECLYPERAQEAPAAPLTDENGVVQDFSRGYSAGSGNPEGYQRRNNNRNFNNGGYNNRPRNNGNNQRRDGNNMQRRPQRPGAKGGFNNRRPQKPKQAKPLLINKEQLAQIINSFKR